MLYTPEQHEPLVDDPWDEGRVRDAVAAIAADTIAAQQADGFWPMHPDDDDGTVVRCGIYLGAAGIVWALRQLGHDLTETADRLYERYLAEPDWPGLVPGFLIGEAGILLTAYRLSPSPETADRLERAVRANARNEANELLFGAPGTMLAAQAMLAATGEDAGRTRGARAPTSCGRAGSPTGSGRSGSTATWCSTSEPGHGFAGNVLALSLDGGLLGAERRPSWSGAQSPTAAALASRENGLANWTPSSAIRWSSAA